MPQITKLIVPNSHAPDMLTPIKESSLRNALSQERKHGLTIHDLVIPSIVPNKEIQSYAISKKDHGNRLLG
jgi:hypothetical protein